MVSMACCFVGILLGSAGTLRFFPSGFFWDDWCQKAADRTDGCATAGRQGHWTQGCGENSRVRDPGGLNERAWRLAAIFFAGAGLIGGLEECASPEFGSGAFGFWRPAADSKCYRGSEGADSGSPRGV